MRRTSVCVVRPGGHSAARCRSHAGKSPKRVFATLRAREPGYGWAEPRRNAARTFRCVHQGGAGEVEPLRSRREAVAQLKPGRTRRTALGEIAPPRVALESRCRCRLSAHAFHRGAERHDERDGSVKTEVMEGESLRPAGRAGVIRQLNDLMGMSRSTSSSGVTSADEGVRRSTRDRALRLPRAPPLRRKHATHRSSGRRCFSPGGRVAPESWRCAAAVLDLSPSIARSRESDGSFRVDQTVSYGTDPWNP